MNFGPLVFLGALFALSLSWFGLVLVPQVQVGRQQLTNTVATAQVYPLARPGLAAQGEQVYRANGCQYCHTQVIRQTGVTTDVVLVEPGTNAVEVVTAIMKLRPDISGAEAQRLVQALPQPVLQGVTKARADAAEKELEVGGAQAEVRLVPQGPDTARGWGLRRTVARDYLLDYPVMLGSQRIGPDLSNIGLRQPDPQWHLGHLYDPQSEVKDSTMPPYRYLFVKQEIQRSPSPEALRLSGEFAPAAGYEIVPTEEAKALAAYLTSLRADAPLFEAPMNLPAAPAATTNVPPDAMATNTPATIVPTQ